MVFDHDIDEEAEQPESAQLSEEQLNDSEIFIAKPESFLTYVCRQPHWNFPDKFELIPTERCSRCHYISYCPRCQNCWRVPSGFCDGRFENLVNES